MSNDDQKTLFERIIENSGSTKSSLHVHFVNTYVMQVALSDENFLKILQDDNSINVFDGKPLLKISKIMFPEGNLASQIRGVDFMRSAFHEPTNPKLAHFLLGGSPTTLNELVNRLGTSANIVGNFSPPFQSVSQMNVDDFIERIVQSGANVVWVGLGTPKQDFIAKMISNRTGITTLCVGAAFDFISGSTPEAPRVFLKFGLEWFFRLITEPKRLWRRYLLGNLTLLRKLFYTKVTNT